MATAIEDSVISQPAAERLVETRQALLGEGAQSEPPSTSAGSWRGASGDIRELWQFGYLYRPTPRGESQATSTQNPERVKTISQRKGGGWCCISNLGA